MPRKKNVAPGWAEPWLHQVGKTGRSNEEISREACARGWPVSAATIGRRLLEIRGSRRSGKHGWTPPGARAPVAQPVAPVKAAEDAAKLVRLLEPNDEPDPQASAAYRATLSAEPDGEWSTATARATERLCLTRPDVREHLAAGHPVPEVLMGYHDTADELTDTCDVISAMGTPTGLATAALESTHSVLYEDAETDAEHDEDHVARARALLRLAAAELPGVQRETYSDRGPEPKS